MRLAATCLSVITALYLIYAFITEQQGSQDSVQVVTSPKQVVPAYISDTPLLVEQVWQKLKADRIKAAQPIQKADNDVLKGKDVISIGDNKFALYGIFNTSSKANKAKHDSRNNQAFILIKGLTKKQQSSEVGMKKVNQGEEISQGVFLVSVTSNSISFKQANDLIEFKLFEAKGQ